MSTNQKERSASGHPSEEPSMIQLGVALPHPERHCGRCRGPNVSWTAPSPLWNQVMRGGDINAPELFGGIVCPTCFARTAEERGIAFGWRLNATDVRVELATTTPSGRVWDAHQWLWV